MRISTIISSSVMLLFALVANAAWAAPSLSLGSASGSPGQTVNIPVTFTNDGSVVALQFDVQYSVSQLASEIPTAGAALGSNGLASSEISPWTRRVVISPTADNAVLGSDEVAILPFTINESASAGTLPLSISNVRMTNASAEPVTPSELVNGAITVSSGNSPPTANAGGPYNGVAGSTIGFDGSGSSDPENDPLTYSWSFGDGATATGVNPAHIYTAAGNYTVSLSVNDGHLTSPAATTLVTVAVPPDLIMTQMSTTSTTALPGSNITLTNAVQNQRNTAAGSFTIAFHLSSNVIYGDSDDVSITTNRSVASLAAGITSSANTNLAIPSNAPPGNFYICAKADSASSVDEGPYENNNTRCTDAPINILYPDLVMTVVTPNATTVNPGSNLSVTNSSKNQGLTSSGGFRVGFVLSANNIYGDGDDVAVSTTRYISYLGSGATNSATHDITISVATPSGNYFVCAKADSLFYIVEADENNNTLCSTSQVTVP